MENDLKALYYAVFTDSWKFFKGHLAVTQLSEKQLKAAEEEAEWAKIFSEAEEIARKHAKNHSFMAKLLAEAINELRRISKEREINAN